jgi:hypothetical protein
MNTDKDHGRGESRKRVRNEFTAGDDDTRTSRRPLPRRLLQRQLAEWNETASARHGEETSPDVNSSPPADDRAG